MIKREDFNGKSYDEMLAAMQADLVAYAEQVSSYETIEDCNNEEQVLMSSMDEVQKYLESVRYELPKNVVVGDKTYSKNDIVKNVIYFLNKIEVKFEHTTGVLALVNLWKDKDLTEISYGAYDSTLRCLNQILFRGATEWEDIIIIDNYFAQCRNDYSLDTGMLIYLSECHNIVMNRMKELDPESNVPEQLQ